CSNLENLAMILTSNRVHQLIEGRGRQVNRPVRIIDLFAGAGGMSLGFEMAGAVPVYAIEVDKWAALTYRKNNPRVVVDERDIESISTSEIEILRDLNADMVIGGPPCQGFSHSNVVNRDPRDPRNSLFMYFIRFISIIRPTIAVIENVPGL